MTSSSGVTGAHDQSLGSSQSGYRQQSFANCFCEYWTNIGKFSRERKTARKKIGKRPLRVILTRIKKLELCREKEGNICRNTCRR